ncbi:MAG: thiamine pyrophosphate-dependent enzyme [Bacillota bacterium]
MATAREYLADWMMPHMWCSGCGNGIVLGALCRVLAELGLGRNEVVITTGIGCWGKADDYMSTSAFHGTHGRALPAATGIKCGNPNLTVLALMGDGDGATIGGNHLIHSARRNIDLTAIVVNNYNYGMTGGQYSGTTPAGKRTTTSPAGNPEREFDLCRVVAAAGAPYVARATVYHVTLMERLIKEAIQKKGFAFVEVASGCPTHYGRLNKIVGPVKMMEWFRDSAVRLGQGEGPLVIGKLVDEDVPDFLERYEALRANTAVDTERDTGR